MTTDVIDWPAIIEDWPDDQATVRSAAVDALAGTTGTGWVERVALDLTDFVAGLWRIHWSAELYETPKSVAFGAQVRLVTDVGIGPVVLAGPAEILNQAAPGLAMAGHWTGALSADRVYRLQWQANTQSATAWIRNARLMAIRK